MMIIHQVLPDKMTIKRKKELLLILKIKKFFFFVYKTSYIFYNINERVKKKLYFTIITAMAKLVIITSKCLI